MKWLFFLLMYLLTSCGSELSRNDARSQIIQSLQLPKAYTTTLYDYTIDPKVLIDRGLVIEPPKEATNYSDDNSSGGGVFIPQVSVVIGYPYAFTEEGEKYIVSKQDGNPEIRLGDLDFDEVTGITKSDQQNTAEVHYTLKHTNLTPFGDALLNINTKIEKVAYFKMFDDGWRCMRY